MKVTSSYRTLLALGAMIRMSFMPAMLVATLVFGVFWYNRAPEIPPGVTVTAKQAPEVKREETIPLTISVPLRVYKPVVKTKLKLPDAAIKDPNAHVATSSKVAANERPHTITTTVDSVTGEFTTYDRTDPLPWVTLNTKSEVGIFYGIKSGDPVLRLQGRQELLQVKAVHLGAVASADMGGGKTETFIGVGAWARW